MNEYKNEDSEWREVSKKWLVLQQQIKNLEEEEKQVRQTLITMANGENVSGGGVRLTKLVRKGNIQYDQIPELRMVDLEKYRKAPIEVWRLLPDRTDK